MALNPDRVTVATYTNKKGHHRVAIQMSRALALRVTVGDEVAHALVLDAITTRIEREETPSEIE